MHFVIDQMVKFQHVHEAHGDAPIKGIARTPIV
jgi:hypothetical protein